MKTWKPAPARPPIDDGAKLQVMFGPIYALTDPQLLPGERLIHGVAQALAGGVRLVQYRDKSAAAHERASRATALLALCRAHGARLIINDHIDLALQIGADGVHLGQDDARVTQARAKLGEGAIVGATCHDRLDLAHLAQTEGASYVAFGRFFNSQTKPLAQPANLDLLQQARVELNVPIVAIGGIQIEHLATLKRLGVNAVAICHALFAGADIRANTENFHTAWSTPYV